MNIFKTYNNLFFIFSKLPIVTSNISQKKKKIKSRTTCYSPPFLMNTSVHPISTFQPALPSLPSFFLCVLSVWFEISSQPLSSILERWFCKEKNIALETVHWLKTEKNDRKGWIKIESQFSSDLYPQPFFTYTRVYSRSYFVFIFEYMRCGNRFVFIHFFSFRLMKLFKE